MHLCLADLARLVDGKLHFGPMPPLAGEWTPVDRIALDSRLVEPGDLFWRLPGLPGQTACSPQHALFRGAAGVASADGRIQPWPGTFCLEVENPVAALARLIDRLDELAAQPRLAELKVLQLCRQQALDMTPPTCGRPARERLGSHCARRAA